MNVFILLDLLSTFLLETVVRIKKDQQIHVINSTIKLDRTGNGEIKTEITTYPIHWIAHRTMKLGQYKYIR